MRLFSLRSETRALLKLSTSIIGVLLTVCTTVSAQQFPPMESNASARNMLFFNGTTQFAQTTVTDFSSPSGTFEAWVEKDNWEEFHDDILFSNGIGHPDNNSFYISLHQSVGLHFRYGGDSQPGNTYCATSAANGFEQFSWHHIAATWNYNSTTEVVELALFVDGVQQANANASVVITPGTQFKIGFNPESGNFGPGMLAEARLWNVARTESEIAASMNTVLAGSESGLIGYWPLRDAPAVSSENKVTGGTALTLMNIEPGVNWRSNVSPALGNLWGMITIGGSLGGNGTIVSVSADGKELSVKKNFNSSEGGYPDGTLLHASNGKFYGTLAGGGSEQKGVLFEFDPITNTYLEKLHFDDVKGRYPHGTPVEGPDGKLYGTTWQGGDNGVGTIYEFDLATGDFTKKFDMQNATGSHAYAGLLLASNGKLYGLAESSTGGGGALFEYDLTSDTYDMKVNFNNATDGNSPHGSVLIQASNGKLYGFNNQGGANNGGTLFEFDPANGDFAVKHHFTPGATGNNSQGRLVEVPNGKLYGVCATGGSVDMGTLFEFDPLTGTLLKKIDFTGPNGKYPTGALALSSDGNLYGMTVNATDPVSSGCIFQYNYRTGIVAKTHPLNQSTGRTPNLSSFIFVKSRQSITFNSLAEKKYGDASFPAGASTSSGFTVSYTSSDENVAYVSDGEIHIVGIGTTVITAYQEGNSTLSAASPAEQTLTVNKASLTIAAENKSRPYKANNPELTFTYSGFVADEDESFITPPTVSSEATTSSNAGDYPITLTGGGADNYAFALVDGTLTISKIDQTITFSEVPVKTFGAAAFTLEASASSGLPVNFTSTTGHTTISDNTVTITSAGSETINASQAGNINYNPVSAPRSFCINPPKPTITADFTNPETPALTSSAAAGNQWYYDGALIANATQQTITVSEEGVYTVVITTEQCSGSASDPTSIVVTGIVSPESSAPFNVYPNPSTTFVTIEFTETGEKKIDMMGIDGRIRHQASTTSQQLQIGLDGFAPGLYILNVRSASGIRNVKIEKR